MSGSCCKAKAAAAATSLSSAQSSASEALHGSSTPPTADPSAASASSAAHPVHQPQSHAQALASTKTSKPPERTFYRRPMPDTCVALSSPEGRKTFTSAHNSGGLKSFFPLMEQFSTQTEPAYCGPTTLVVILNALAVDPRRTWKGTPWRWYEESFLNCCVDLEMVKETGITLGTFACLAKCQGLTVEAHHGSDKSVDEFRDAVKAACLEHSTGTNVNGNSTTNHQFLAVSYSRKVVGQTGDGHFSPIAAYDETSDSVLVLDTARFKYGPHWMPVQVMYSALQPIDEATGKSRGYVLLSYDYNDHDQSMNMPPRSILFRSKKGQDPTRQLFKEYMRNEGKTSKVSFEDIVRYWTKDGRDVDYIWSILDAQLVPTSREEEDMVTNARSLLTDLVGYVSSNASPAEIKERYDERLLYESKSMCVDSCSGNSCDDTFTSRKIAISSIEAILVVYLSTLESDEIRKLFQSFKEESGQKNYPSLTYEQMICEADLICYAIEASDESEDDVFRGRSM